MSDKTFQIVGYSVLSGVLKLRWANDMNRDRVLERKGHENVNLFELPYPMGKTEAARWLHRRRGMSPDVRNLINQFLTAAQENYPGSDPRGRNVVRLEPRTMPV